MSHSGRQPAQFVYLQSEASHESANWLWQPIKWPKHIRTRRIESTIQPMHLSYKLFPWCHKSISKCFTRGFLFYFFPTSASSQNIRIYNTLYDRKNRKKRIKVNWKTIDLNETVCFLSLLVVVFVLFALIMPYFLFFSFSHMDFILTTAIFYRRNFSDQWINHISINLEVIGLNFLPLRSKNSTKTMFYQ